MELRVLHKGLILVAVPLLLQLVVIGCLGALLYQIDTEQSKEAERCRLSIIGSRLLFANCQAGNILLEAFKMQNVHLLDNFYQECDYIDKMNREMSVVPQDDAVEGRQLQLKCLKAQSVVTARMREIADMATGGFGMDTLRSVLQSHRKLVKELDAVFSLLRIRYQNLDAGLPDRWRNLQRLQAQENTVIISAAISTLLMGLGLIWFYRKEFLLRIKKVTADVESLTLGRSLSSPLKGNDEISGLDASFHNMSIQLAAVAERERALFENSSDMICILDQDLRFLRANKAATRFCNYDANELIGKPISSILGANSENEIEQIRERLRTARATRTASGFETKLQGPEQNEIITLWSIFWSPDQKSCHCVVHDVSEERRLDKMREAFLRLIAADFSKPLSHIAGLVDKLAAGAFGALPEMATKKIVGATGTLSRMVTMVDELLQLETVKSSSLNLNRKPTEVRSVLQETIKDTEAAAEKKQIKLEIDCPENLKFNVDFDRIVRVLMNFVSNAIKFSPEASTVKLAAESKGDSIVLSVIDQGRGIPKEALNSLFQAFKQVSSADGKRGKGTGLGLVVCKRIVEEHGGQVGVESEENKGSRFFLTIPTIAIDAPASTGNGRSAGGSPASNPVAALFGSSNTELAPKNPSLPAKNSAKTNFWERLNFKQKGMLLLGLPIACQAIFAGAMIYFLSESSQSFEKQMHNRFVIRNAIRTAAPFFQLLIALRTEGQEATGASTCRTVMAEEGERVSALKSSVQGDALATDYYKRISLYLKNTLLPLNRRLIDDLAEYGGKLDESENRRYANVVVGMLGGLTMHVQELVNACEARDKDTPVRLKQLRQFEVGALIAGLILNIVAAAWLAFYFSTDIMRRLLVLSDNSQRLASGAALNKQLSGSDEIALLDKAFHETAERLAEARATESTFLDNANNIICSINEKGRFVSLNSIAADKLAIPFDKYQEHTLFAILPPDERPRLEEFLNRAKDSKSASTIELKVQAAEQNLDFVWSFLWSESEQQYFAVAYDITARRDLDRMKKEFLALVTHDLRTPLTTIQGMAILLETDKLGVLPAPARDCLGKIKQESNQILELVNDLLDLSKLEAGEMNCEFTPMSSTELVEKLSALLKDTGMKLQLVGDSSSFPADHDRLPYAISGMILELFAEGSDLKINTANNQFIVTGPGAKSLSENDLVTLNSDDISGYSSTSTRRLRLPLSRKLLQMHQAKCKITQEQNGSAPEITLLLSR